MSQDTKHARVVPSANVREFFRQSVDVAIERQRLEADKGLLRSAVRHRLDESRNRLEVLYKTLEALGPAATLERGYAIVTLPEGPIVRDPAQVTRGQDVSVRVAKGRFSARVTDEDQERS